MVADANRVPGLFESGAALSTMLSSVGDTEGLQFPCYPQNYNLVETTECLLYTGRGVSELWAPGQGLGMEL